MPMNMRPKDNPDALAYSVERDVAYLGPKLLITAAKWIDSERYFDHYKAEFEAAGVKYEDFGPVAKAFGDAVQTFMVTPSIRNFGEAVQQTGFFNTPGLNKHLYMAVFGQLMFVAMLRGIRETGRFNEDTVQQKDISIYLATIEDYLRQFGYEVPASLDSESSDVHDLRMTVAHQKAMIESLQARIDENQVAISPTDEAK